MKQLARADTYGDVTTRITHVFSTDTHYAAPKDALPQNPFLVLADNKSAQEFLESFRDSPKTHSEKGVMDLYIIQRRSSLKFTLKDIQTEFEALLLKTFDWPDGISLHFSESRELTTKAEHRKYKFPLMSPKDIAGSILSGEIFTNQASVDLWNDHAAHLRSVMC